jgi:hypothetical protein
MVIERDLRMRIALDAHRVAQQAVLEDGTDDISSAVTVSPGQLATGAVETRTGGVVAGIPYADAVAETTGLTSLTWYHAAGTRVDPGTTLGLLQGDLRLILRAERPLLNLLKRAVARSPGHSWTRWTARAPRSSTRERPLRASGFSTSPRCWPAEDTCTASTWLRRSW